MKELNNFEAEDMPTGEDPRDGHVLLHLPKLKLDGHGSLRTRPLFHGSYKGHNGRSLNDCLLKGGTGGMLVRLRMYPSVCVGDLRKAFLQMRVSPEDRQYMRFLTMAPDGSIAIKQEP